MAFGLKIFQVTLNLSKNYFKKKSEAPSICSPWAVRTQVCSIGMSYLPTAPKAVRYGNRVLRVFLGIGGGLKLRPTTTHHRQSAKANGEKRKCGGFGDSSNSKTSRTITRCFKVSVIINGVFTKISGRSC